MNIRPCGPLACLIDCPSESVLSVAHTMRESGYFVDVVPSELSVLVTWDPVVAITHQQILELAHSAPEHLANDSGRLCEIPVSYDGADLADVALATGLSVAQVIELHTTTTFYAAFAGFAPGFMYCTGLASQLVLPRRSSPRVAVPAGSVAIADLYSAVYPIESPGGWHLLGTTSVPMFDIARNPVSFLSPGDTVRFVQVWS